MHIGILDPDPAERALVHQLLEKTGFDCAACDDVGALEAAGARRPFDALVVACGRTVAPDPALHVIRTFTPTVATLAMVGGGREDEIVAALSAGAGDYLIKPIRPSELVARLQALLRRAYPHETQERFDFPPYRFLPDESQVIVGTAPPVALTQKEFDLAVVLFRNAGRPLSRSHLRELVWGGDADVSSRTMDTHVSRLRNKLGLGAERGFRVMPVYGYGYRLDRVESSGADEARSV